MIPTEFHNEVHSALLRRKSTVDLWGSALNNGYIGLVLCFHSDKDEILIAEISDYFERNLVLHTFLNDPKNIAAVALYCAILTKQGQKIKATQIAKLVNDKISAIAERESSKYHIFNRPELTYALTLGLSRSGGENLRPSQEILAISIQNGLTNVGVENVQRIVFFLAAGLEMGFAVSPKLSDFLTKLQLSRLQIYDVIPLIWFLLKYREKIGLTLKDSTYLKGLLSQHIETGWKQFGANIPYLSFNPPLPSADEEFEKENTYVLSVLELVLLDDMIIASQLREGVYPPDLYAMLRLHSVIRTKTEKLFKEGNYNQAVSEAFMALVDMVKEKAGYPKGSDGKELDGTGLMEQVFSIKKPMLKFNEMKSQTELDEQMGLMELFKGSVLAIRNVFHHKSRDKQEDPHRTIEYLQFASFLAEKLDDAVAAY